MCRKIRPFAGGEVMGFHVYAFGLHYTRMDLETVFIAMGWVALSVFGLALALFLMHRSFVVTRGQPVGLLVRVVVECSVSRIRVPDDSSEDPVLSLCRWCGDCLLTLRRVFVVCVCVRLVIVACVLYVFVFFEHLDVYRTECDSQRLLWGGGEVGRAGIAFQFTHSRNRWRGVVFRASKLCLGVCFVVCGVCDT